MEDMTLTASPTTPEGMISTPSGRILNDDGHGRLVQLLDEAYELHNDHMVVSIVGREPFQLFVGDHLEADGSVVLADDLRILAGGAIQDPQSDDGIVAWCGGHVVGTLRTERFRIDGKAATIVLEDAMANIPAYEK